MPVLDILFVKVNLSPKAIILDPIIKELLPVSVLLLPPRIPEKLPERLLFIPPRIPILLPERVLMPYVGDINPVRDLCTVYGTPVRFNA